MISLNSLAAFTAEVTRNAGLSPARGATGIAVAGMGPRDEAGAGPGRASAPRQRLLLSVPPHPPAHPLPRGSLLDLRV
ncbi:MAG: hypothetical protein IRZ13_07440 [Acetobacteraceae bacterium]|nr:hypothetical protein [Acetobacteraceae bacterium]